MLYIFTSQHSTGASAYVLPMGYLTEDLRWEPPRVEKAFHELALKPHILRDPRTNVVFIPGWWDHNKPENPKVAAFVVKQLLLLPDCTLKIRAVQGLIDTKYRETAVLDAVGNWTPSEKQEDLGLISGGGQGNLLSAPPTDAPKAASTAKPKAQGSRLPADWVAPAAYRDYASQQGLSDERIDQLVARFLRYWTGPDASDPVKKDWFRTWQNWIDREADRAPKNGNGAGNHSSGENFGISGPDWASREVGYYGAKKFWLQSWGPKPDEAGYQGPKKKRVAPPQS